MTEIIKYGGVCLVAIIVYLIAINWLVIPKMERKLRNLAGNEFEQATYYKKSKRKLILLVALLIVLVLATVAYIVLVAVGWDRIVYMSLDKSSKLFQTFVAVLASILLVVLILPTFIYGFWKANLDASMYEVVEDEDDLVVNDEVEPEEVKPTNDLSSQEIDWTPQTIEDDVEDLVEEDDDDDEFDLLKNSGAYVDDDDVEPTDFDVSDFIKQNDVVVNKREETSEDNDLASWLNFGNEPEPVKTKVKPKTTNAINYVSNSNLRSLSDILNPKPKQQQVQPKKQQPKEDDGFDALSSLLGGFDSEEPVAKEEDSNDILGSFLGSLGEDEPQLNTQAKEDLNNFKESKNSTRRSFDFDDLLKSQDTTAIDTDELAQELERQGFGNKKPASNTASKEDLKRQLRNELNRAKKYNHV